MLLALPSLFAQHPIMKRYGSYEGLTFGDLYDAHEDSELRMWFASEEGLVTFDGDRFQLIDTNGKMPSPDVIKISEDRSGALWLHTLSGIPIKYTFEEGLALPGPKAMEDLRGSNYISAYSQSVDGTNYFGTNDGKAFCIRPDGRFEFLFKAPYGSIVLIEHMHDCEAVFHFSDTKAIGHYEKGKIEIIFQTPLFQNWKYGTLRATVISEKRFMYGLENRISFVKLDGDTLKMVKEVLLPERNVIFVEKDNLGDLWIGTTEGAVQFDVLDTLFANPKRYLTGKTVTSILRDHERGLWFVTSEGIYHCRNENVTTIGWPEEKPNREVTTLHLGADGFIYAGFSNGKVSQLSRRTGLEVANFDLSFGNPSPSIHKIADGPNGVIIVAGNSGLFSILASKVTVLSRYKFSDFSSVNETACGCFYSGWKLMDMDSLLLFPESAYNIIKKAIAGRSNRCLKTAVSREGEVWIVNVPDLLRIRNHVVDTVAKGIGESISIIKALGPQEMAFGTNNMGLFLLKNSHLRRMSVSDGLLDNQIKDLAIDSKGEVWVLTSKGISKFVRQSDSYAFEFSRNISILSDHLPVERILVLGDTIWGATREGCVYFPIQELKSDLVAPITKIEGVWANNIPQSIKGAAKFAHDQNRIRIKFRSCSWGDASLLEYRYRILGIDSLYQITNSEVLDLPGLAPNQYVLEIQSRHPSGTWSPEVARFEFTILAPFWQTWWFVLLSFAFIFVLAAYGILLILRNAKRKSDIREALLTAKHNALMSQMNPHFIFNSLNSIQYFVLNKETDVASDYLADFAALMRAILVNARSAFIGLSEEIRFLELYLRLESLRLGHNFDYAVSISPDVMPSTISIPTMMLQPLLENSIWHGVASLKDRKGHILISFTIQNGYLDCRVVDNGVGRNKNREKQNPDSQAGHKSVSSEILNERISLLNETLKIKIQFEIVDLLHTSGEPKGTEVRISFPIDILNPIKE